MAGPSTGPLNDPDRFKGLPDRVGFTPLVLMLVAPYYGDVADALVKGAEAEFEKAGVNVKRIDVPGALELPQALQIVLDGDTGFAVDAAVAIGCVIRGETSHYDIVCNETNRGLMTIALDARVPLGQRGPDRRHTRAGDGTRHRWRHRQGRRCGACGAGAARDQV
jgi:6,7-dimethyl-8-ribityllumazine synthase